MTFGCSVLHVIRDALVVMLSEAKHLSHPFAYYHPFFLSHSHFSRFAQATLSIATESSYCSAPCHFARASHCHFARARPIVMLSGAKHLSHHSAHCHFDRAERVEKSGMLCAAPSSEYTVSDDYSAGAAGISTPKGSPRAWLLPEYHPPQCPYRTFSEKSVTPNVQVPPKVAVLWTRNALSMNRLTINTVGIFDPPC